MRGGLRLARRTRVAGGRAESRDDFAPGTHHLPKMPGRKLSLLAYSPEVRDVTLTGAKWTLTRATLTYRYPLGCSNEFTADMAEVTFREGLLMVCFSADKNP